MALKRDPAERANALPRFANSVLPGDARAKYLRELLRPRPAEPAGVKASANPRRRFPAA
jgi:hypothetical protein